MNNEVNMIFGVLAIAKYKPKATLIGIHAPEKESWEEFKTQELYEKKYCRCGQIMTDFEMGYLLEGVDKDGNTICVHGEIIKEMKGVDRE